MLNQSFLDVSLEYEKKKNFSLGNMAESTPALAGTETVTELHQTSHLEHKLEYDSIFCVSGSWGRSNIWLTTVYAYGQTQRSRVGREPCDSHPKRAPRVLRINVA